MSRDDPEKLGNGLKTTESVRPTGSQLSGQPPPAQLRIRRSAIKVTQSNYLSLHSSYGNAAVMQELLQHNPDRGNLACATQAAPPFIVEDTAKTFKPCQMKKSDFLAELRSAVSKAMAEALGDTEWAEAGFLYIEQWFDYYSRQSSEHIERVIQRYAPEAGAAQTANGYIQIVTGRVSEAVSRWAKAAEIRRAPSSRLTGGMKCAMERAISAMRKMLYKRQQEQRKKKEKRMR